MSSPVPHYHVGILGTGFSGLGMAIQLKQAGIHDFVVLEKAGDVGGTWRDNSYPGAACDVPSYLYCFSFEPHTWTRTYARQPEILGYLRHCADKYGIRPHIRFNQNVTDAVWSDKEQRWSITTADGKHYTADIVVSGKGGLHIPEFPNIPGRDRFQGVAMHSAQWRHDVSLQGKRVAVIGTGASAIQVVPAIAGEVAELQLYQRTPAWVLPKVDRAYSFLEKTVLGTLPLAQRAHRAQIYCTLEPRAAGFVLDPRIMKLAENMGRSYINRKIQDPVRRAKVTPNYTMGCKRILLSNNYYPALARENVNIITEGVQEVREHSVVDAQGVEREVDVIIYCTGFKATDYLYGMNITGSNGTSLNQQWSQGADAYYGISVKNMPNFFMLMGPNTGLGHNSMVYMIESQIHYAVEAIKKLHRSGARVLAVKEQVQDKYMDSVQGRMGRSVWSSGCQSWYMDENGRNYTLWPGFTLEYRLRTSRFKAGDYTWTRR